MKILHRARAAVRAPRPAIPTLVPEPASAAHLPDDSPQVRYGIPEHLRHPPDDLLTVGDHTIGRPTIEWYAGDTARVVVGKYCSLHHTAVIFVGGEHRGDWVTTAALREILRLPGRFESGLPHTRGDVVLGNDVYLGYEAFVRSGVTIGDGAIVAARAVVTRDVEPFAIVAGNPARLVKYRFDEPLREALLRIRWWDWPEEKVIEYVDSLSNPDVAAFVAQHDPEPR
jgi:acetyltransferase-like isoleucine patch superfamily enzyme